jgi:hypothetical protein
MCIGNFRRATPLDYGSDVEVADAKNPGRPEGDKSASLHSQQQPPEPSAAAAAPPTDEFKFKQRRDGSIFYYSGTAWPSVMQNSMKSNSRHHWTADNAFCTFFRISAFHAIYLVNRDQYAASIEANGPSNVRNIMCTR